MSVVEAKRFDPDLMRRLGRLDLSARALADGLDLGRHASRRKGFSTEFSDYRPYVAGDDPRALDWRVLARTDRLYVKRYAAETELELTLVMDCSRSFLWRHQDHISKFEYAATLAAALACVHLRQHDAVGLLVTQPGGAHYLAPSARHRRFHEILGELSAVQSAGPGSFSQLLASLAGLRRHRGELHLWSDAEEPAKPLRQALEQLAGQQDDLVFFHLLDAAEVNLPESHATHLRDSETGALLPVDWRAWRARHAGRVAQFRQQWRDLCQTLGILYQPLHTGQDYFEAVQQYQAGRQAW
jgi:uncharacterized protein (DUF58 family)